MIHPSPAIIARADTSIADCVRLMRDHQVGSILIVNTISEGVLVGIFTERDLVKKIDEIQSGDHWLRPISRVMTTPVRSLDLSEIENAAKLMLQYKIRHFPITLSDSYARKRILGVISMRDLFRNLVIHQEAVQELESAPQVKTMTPLSFALITQDESFAQLIKKVFAVSISKSIERIQIDDPKGNEFNAFVLDLDSISQNPSDRKIESERWSKRLKEIHHNSEIKWILIALDYSRHPLALIEVLEKLEKSKKILIFKKPIEISQLIYRLQKAQ